MLPSYARSSWVTLTYFLKHEILDSQALSPPPFCLYCAPLTLLLDVQKVALDHKLLEGRRIFFIFCNLCWVLPGALDIGGFQ